MQTKETIIAVPKELYAAFQEREVNYISCNGDIVAVAIEPWIFDRLKEALKPLENFS